MSDLNELSSLDINENKWNEILKSKKAVIFSGIVLFLLLTIIAIFL